MNLPVHPGGDAARPRHVLHVQNHIDCGIGPVTAIAIILVRKPVNQDFQSSSRFK
ncbi:hypothetical protein PQR66_03890 [Paraburkholderia agricolaris]|uniref:Uncharacterized protein n=1 Tax=Paraburkholderia agricolaris TaxID=2152888 RepID=A0ABW8ZJK3_9BURK